MKELFYMVWLLDKYGDKKEGFAPMTHQEAKVLLGKMRLSGMEDDDEQYIIAIVPEQRVKEFFGKE